MMIDIENTFWNKYWKWYHMRLFRPQKFMSVVIRTTLSGITARSITLFTPTFWYFYTDIAAISVTFCNSGHIPTKVDQGWSTHDLRVLKSKARSSKHSYIFRVRWRKKTVYKSWKLKWFNDDDDYQAFLVL